MIYNKKKKNIWIIKIQIVALELGMHLGNTLKSLYISNVEDAEEEPITKRKKDVLHAVMEYQLL